MNGWSLLHPFPEMQGNIVFVDYDLSSWRYMNDDPYVPSKYAKYICGQESLPENSGIVIKGGYIPTCDFYIKGMGSAYGGEWQPAKEDDERFLGEPDEVKETWAKTRKGGYRRSTKIGEDGRAVRERHWTDHGRPWEHTDPHEHIINWDPNRGNPLPGPQMNFPDGAPEFKTYRKEINMYKSSNDNSNWPECNRFKTISEFKWCIHDGGEIELVWNEKIYSITRCQSGEIGISEAYKQETEKLCKNADEVLEYMLDGEQLRDIITKVEVTDRTI